MTDRPIDPTAAPARKPWQTPVLTVLPADDAENTPIAVQGDGPISMGS